MDFLSLALVLQLVRGEHNDHNTHVGALMVHLSTWLNTIQMLFFMHKPLSSMTPNYHESWPSVVWDIASRILSSITGLQVDSIVERKTFSFRESRVFICNQPTKYITRTLYSRWSVSSPNEMWDLLRVAPQVAAGFAVLHVVDLKLMVWQSLQWSIEELAVSAHPGHPAVEQTCFHAHVDCLATICL